LREACAALAEALGGKVLGERRPKSGAASEKQKDKNNDGAPSHGFSSAAGLEPDAIGEHGGRMTFAPTYDACQWGGFLLGCAELSGRRARPQRPSITITNSAARDTKNVDGAAADTGWASTI
jgi:hypothetical protein